MRVKGHEVMKVKALLLVPLQRLLQELRSVTYTLLDDFFGGATGNELSTSATSFGAHVYEVVGCADDVEVVLNDDDRIAFLYQSIEHAEQHSDIFEVEPRGGFVENVYRLPRVAFGEFRSEFHALTFPT